MAKNDKPEVAENVKPAEERVDIYIERGSDHDDPNLFVSVNGVNYLLPKGQTSSVPRHVAQEIQRSRRAQQRQDRNRDALRHK